MTRHNDDLALRHMWDHASEAVKILEGRSREALSSDRLFSLALTKLVEIIGEAAGRISDSTHAAHPGIPWRGIVGTRNRLVHGYDAIDYDVLWRIVSIELPELLEQLRPIVGEGLDGESPKSV